MNYINYEDANSSTVVAPPIKGEQHVL